VLSALFTRLVKAELYQISDSQSMPSHSCALPSALVIKHCSLIVPCSTCMCIAIMLLLYYLLDTDTNLTNTDTDIVIDI